MAINISDKYPGRSNPPSIDYPQGSIKNQTAPGARDGTPLDEAWANDKEGFFQSLLSGAGVVANGLVDKVGASQYFDALKNVIKAQTRFATQAEFDSHTSSDKVVSPLVMQPKLTGSATLTSSSNSIALTGIVASLGLEKGDVIRVVAGSYNKLHTVESLTNANNIVVNYEHCGNRCNGPLKLPDYTGAATVTRIVKWFSAPIGVGQAWVNVTALRAGSVEYLNTSGRPIVSNIYSSLSEGGFGFSVTVDGVGVGNHDSSAAEDGTISSITGNSSKIKLNLFSVTISAMSWLELR